MNLLQLSNSINNSIKTSIDKYLDKDRLKFDFKKKFSLEDRKYQSERIMKKYPNRIPVICNVSIKLPALDKHKYLIPDNMNSTDFFFILRKRLKLNENKAMYFFVKDKTLIPNILMSRVYNKYQDEDGFLYIFACSENTFG
tara:strand:+ start:1175 stop:1597 length:423 start_codon:yes stop_codon:yes gene_type:complete